MSKPEKTSDKIAKKQKVLYLSIGLALVLTVGCAVYVGERKPAKPKAQPAAAFNIVSEDIKSENVRLAELESLGDALGARLQSLEQTLHETKEEKQALEQENTALSIEAEVLQAKLNAVQAIKDYEAEHPPENASIEPAITSREAQLTEWTSQDDQEDKHVLFQIPAGTVVKAVLVSGADCSVAVQKPTGPSMVLLRPLDNGRLPKNVRVPLKGSVLVCNAIGDIASERVYVRGERMTLVQPNGEFVETEVSAYISGEDGREGMRGVVVDRSGKILTRAGFASFLQGVSSGIQAALNNQTLEKISKVGDSQTILNVDTFRDSALQGASSSLDRLSAYYIKRAEQLQPTIQIAAGRVVDIVFTKTVKVGEQNLQKKFEHERMRLERERLRGQNG